MLEALQYDFIQNALLAGLLAAVAVGIEPDIAKAAEMVGGIADTIEPDGDTKPAYDEAYGTYRNLFEALRPMF